MDKITISVIIPTFNAKNHLGRAICSVLEQSDPPDEIIVVDDGSNDGTAVFVQEQFSQVNYVYQQNQGVSAARNLGARQAKGAWLAFLDADDLWFRAKLAKQKKIIQRHQGIKMVTAGRVWLSKSGELRRKQSLAARVFKWNFWFLLSHNTIPTPSVLVERDAFWELGGFDESLETGEDWDLWLKFIARNSVYGTTQKLVGIQRVEGSLSSNRLRIMMNNIDILSRWQGYAVESGLFGLYQWMIWQHTFHSLRRLHRWAAPQEIQRFWELSYTKLPIGKFGLEILRRYFGLPVPVVTELIH